MTQSITTPCFQTQSLNVFRNDIKPNDVTNTRAVFFGFLRDEEICWPVVTATVWVHGPYLGHTLEMIQTHDDHRREGLARELWLGIEEFLDGAVLAIPDSPEGAALAESVAQLRESMGRVTPDLTDTNVQLQVEQAFLRQQMVLGEMPFHAVTTAAVFNT